MWRKHPIARLIMGLAVVLVVSITLGAAVFFWSDFWQDGREAPLQIEGTVKSINLHPPSTMPGHFKLVTDGGDSYDFDLKSGLLRQMNYYLQSGGIDRTQVAVTFSPHMHNVYNIKVAGVTSPLVQDTYKPGQAFQDWQNLPLYLMSGILLIGIAALIYTGLALADWLWPLQRLQGALVARIERAEARSEGFSIVVRPWNNIRPGKQSQFELDQTNFLATDGVDFIEVTYTRFFHYVRQLRPLSLEELPSSARDALVGLSAEGLRLSYFPGWRLRVFLYADGIFSLGLFSVAGIILLNYLPEWSNPQQIEPPQWLLFPLIAMLAIVGGIYLLLRFTRKMQDIKAPKRVTTGPVLSKWRVTGTSNDNRRLIVVADGGLAAGEQGVRKFDLSPALFDQLRVGDIVEIEHTPRLRYICRLEVKGHQELSRSFQV